LSQKEVHATESINGNSDISHRYHVYQQISTQEKMNCRLIKIAGTLSLEAVDALCSNFAVNSECMMYKNILGEYPTCYTGLG
jgi:hypothetical protein